MTQTGAEKVERLKEFAKSASGKHANAISTLTAHQKLLEDAENKADTLYTCITEAARRHYEALLDIVGRLNSGDLSDIYSLIDVYEDNLIHDHGFLVDDHPAMEAGGSLFGPFAPCIKPVNDFSMGVSSAFVRDDETKVYGTRSDLEGCYCNIKTTEVYPDEGSIQVGQASNSTGAPLYQQTASYSLVNAGAFGTRLSAWSVHAPLTGAPSVVRHPADEADMNMKFNGDQDPDTQQGAISLFFNLKHMNNKWFQYPVEKAGGAHEELGTGLPGVGMHEINNDINNIARTLIGQQATPGAPLSWKTYNGSYTANNFCGILERQLAQHKEVEANGDKFSVSGPGGMFIFCPKAMYVDGYTEKFVQTGLDTSAEPQKRLFNAMAGYTDLIYCESGNIEKYSPTANMNTLLDFTDDATTWRYPKIGETSNGSPSFKHGTLDGLTSYPVFPLVPGSKDVYFTCMLTNQHYSPGYDVYDYRISATAVYEFEDYLKANLGYDLTDCVFVFVTHPSESLDDSHLPYAFPDEIVDRWSEGPWTGVVDFSRRPHNHIHNSTHGWHTGDSGGFETYLTPYTCFGSTQLMGFNTLGSDGLSYSEYYSRSNNYPVLGSGGVPFTNADFHRQNTSSVAMEDNETLELMDRQQPIYYFLIRELSHPRTGVANTIAGLEQIIPILEQEAAMYEDMIYESAEQDAENTANTAVQNCLFDNYTGISYFSGSVVLETPEEGNINPMVGSLMTISQKVNTL